MFNNNSAEMRVQKRNGSLEEISFDKILNRIKKLGHEANIQINYSSLVMKVIDQLYDKIPTTKIDELAAEQCASLSTLHPDYGTLAARIVVSNHHKNTEPNFSDIVNTLYNFTDIHGLNYPLVSSNLYNFVSLYSNEINNMIVHDRDYLIDYFGFKTLERAYLFKYNGQIIERPQHMWMRVAIGIHGSNKEPNSLALVKETYELTVPGDFPRSVDKPILDDFPLIGYKGVSENSASTIWKDYPVFDVGSFKQLTNNIRYNRNPDNGKCSRAEFCGALYHDAKHLPNVITPLPPAQEGPGARVGYYRSEPNDLFFSIPTNENILY